MHPAAPASRPSRSTAHLVWTEPAAGGGSMRQRSFRAADGGMVTVREVSVPAAPWVRGPRCLLFERDGVIRRVWRYPDDWAEGTDAALDALSWVR